MARRYSDIVILNTPFQLRQFLNILEIEGRINHFEETLILYSKFLNVSDLQTSLGQATLEKLPFEAVNFNALLQRGPQQAFKELREKKNIVKNFVNSISPADIRRVYFFTDKEYFVQCFLWFLKNRRKHITFVYGEEGVGSYVKEKLKDRMRNIMYLLGTTILLGLPVRYVRTLGTHPFINMYYCRLPEYLPIKKSHIKYFKIPAPDLIDATRTGPSNEVLILTNPNSLTGEFVYELINFFMRKGYVPILKPHPRDNMEFYRNFNCKILDPRSPSEQLNYQQYRFIVHFYSSALVDAFSRGYPLKNVITFLLHKTQVELDFFRMTNVFESIDDLEKFINGIGRK